MHLKSIAFPCHINQSSTAIPQLFLNYEADLLHQYGSVPGSYGCSTPETIDIIPT